jgi:hypothetical protein
MKPEHHHVRNMAHPGDAFNLLAATCDLSARLRLLKAALRPFWAEGQPSGN